MGSIIGEYMDTDLMDIGRRISIIDPETGITGETKPEDPIYRNVKCHIEFNSPDNPDPQSIDIMPKIISITIHCHIDIDLQNNDFIVAKKCDAKGEVLAVYKGIIGNPIMNQSRQSAILGISG